MDSTVVMGDDEWVALDVLRGDLDAIEGEACAAGIETAGIEGVEYLGEGDLDGTAVFEDAEPEVPVHFDGRRGGVWHLAPLGMMGRHRLNMAILSPVPSPPVSARKYLVFQRDRAWASS
jgi:hypothetical protein